MNRKSAGIIKQWYCSNSGLKFSYKECGGRRISICETCEPRRYLQSGEQQIYEAYAWGRRVEFTKNAGGNI
jgi:hypothetical protein